MSDLAASSSDSSFVVLRLGISLTLLDHCASLAGDIIDLEMISWGFGYIEAQPSRKELELNPKHPLDVLNHTSQLWQVVSMLRDGVIGDRDGDLIFKCQHGRGVSIRLTACRSKVRPEARRGTPSCKSAVVIPY